MAKKRILKRLLGLFKARLPELGLEQVPDPRKARGKRWSLGVVLKTCLVSLTCRLQSLSELELFSEEMGTGMKSLLGLPRRLPDTTAREVLVRLSPHELRQCLHRQTKAARRRKALKPVGLPFGVVAIDGKGTALDAWDARYAQRKREGNGQGAHGLLRTLTCSLVSSAAKVCLDAYPIPAHTNEIGAFPNAFRCLCRVYGRKLFALVSTDAGMSSLENADLVVGYDKHYLFGCKQDQPTLLAEAQRLLARKRKPLAETVDLRGNLEVHRRLYLTQEMAGFLNWRHLQTVVRVESEVRQVETGLVESRESRYYLSSLPANRLSPQQWLLVVRNHWGVENQGHWTLDAVFEEDDRPWIRMSPKGALVVMLLRRMAYNLLALYRSVTQRSESRRQMPWKELMRRVYHAVLLGDVQLVAQLRSRPALTR